MGTLFLGDPLETINLLAGEISTKILVPLNNNDIEEVDGEITVEIEPSEHYHIDPDDQSAQVNVTNDDIYLVSINTTSTQVNEGDTIDYIVTISPGAPQSGIAVTVTNIGEGGFITDFEEILEFEHGDTQQTYSIQSIDENTFTADGQVTAIIQPEENYTIQSGEGRITTTITDNDAPGGISVIALTDSIIEGETAQFQITTSQIFRQEKEINIAITEIGNFMSDQLNLPDSVIIDSGQRVAMVEVDTAANALVEENGRISLALPCGRRLYPSQFKH